MKGRKGTPVFYSLYPVLSFCLPFSEFFYLFIYFWTVLTGRCAEIRRVSVTLLTVSVVCVCVYLLCVWLRFVCVF